MIRCLECGSDQIERLAWCNVNNLDHRDWEKDRRDMHAAQVQCGDCAVVYPVSELERMDDCND